MEIVSVIKGIGVYERYVFKGLSGKDVDCLRSTISKFNNDFEKRKVDGQPTTLVGDAVRDERHECYTFTVCRYPGVLGKRGRRYILPKHPLAD